MWLTFTTGTLEGSSSSIQISEIPPERWERGIKHRVLMPVWEIHNYAGVKADPHDPNSTVGKPEKRRLPWFRGVKDGEPTPTPAPPPFGHPPPPRVHERRDERAEEDRRDRERRDRVNRIDHVDEHPDFHDVFGRRRDDHDDDRDRWPRDQRGQGRRDSGEHGRGRHYDATRRNRSRSPRRRGDGHDEHGGRRRDEDAPRREPARRERAASREITRSPRPAVGHEQTADDAARELEARRQRDLKLMFHLKVATMADVASKMFNLQGHKNTTSPRSPLQQFSTVSRLVDELGDEVWFDHNNRHNYKTEEVVQEDQLSPTDGHGEHPQHTLTALAPDNSDEPSPQTPQGLVPQPPPAPGKRGRRLKKLPVAVSSLRRSKRQACSRLKHLPAEQRASHVLCRRLGYIKDDITPAEQAIQEFVATFTGPMPEFIVAGLTAMFRLDDDDICSATAALIKLGGQEAADTLPEVNNGA
ncbi:unnamed protein product [Urochloa decumbens]|uniref:Uncharacterized protein n=1 Tax=Urochloa decumbens TaxID=240449 RepID=A0ABC9ETV6_9POAL